MRILVLQLARFGDIYQTWPVLRAIRRKTPGAEVHLLVRERFQAAVQGLEGVICHSLPTAGILEPLLIGDDEAASLVRLEDFLNSMTDLNFDQVINLSFSPVSSYFAEAIAQDKTEQRGYTRHIDGALRIPDDSSAYFYAQGRLGGFNRYHVTEIFAAVAGVELSEDDYQATPKPEHRGQHIVVHMGASHASRLYPPEQWVKVVSDLAESESVLLVGSQEERPLCETVEAQVNNENVQNLAGKTELVELMHIIRDAKLVVGCDSAPVQIATLTDTPVLHLSSSTANFWTTGPISRGTRVLYQSDLAQISAQLIASEAKAMLQGQPAVSASAIRPSRLGTYEILKPNSDDFGWHLIEALYTQTSFPTTTENVDLLAFQRIFELAELALVQLEKWARDGVSQAIAEILAQIDTMLDQTAELNPRVRPVVEWFNTERLRMGPAPASEILAHTTKLFGDLHLICAVYRRYQNPTQENARAIEICKGLAPALREFDVQAVSGPFQDLLSTLHELSRHSTKVGEQEWSAVLIGLHTALERRDFIEVADQLEYVLVPALS